MLGCCKEDISVVNTVSTPRVGNRILLVGINKYPGAPLAGCVNDVTDMANYLVDVRKLDARDICILTDERAGTDAILEQLTWLAETPSGKMAYFHYSGHGAQVPGHGEEDGMSEVICPVNFDWSPARMITDKDFVSIFEHMSPGVIFNWASDSCHSGDLSRELRKDGTKVTPRRMPAPHDIAWHIERNRGRVRTLRETLARTILNVGYVSGCQADQTSADAFIDGRPCGAFTHFYLKHLKSEPETTPLNKLGELVSGDLAANDYEQRPSVEGARAKMPFLK